MKKPASQYPNMDYEVNQRLITRSSLPEVFCKKGVPRNFTKFKGKHLCQSLFSNKVAGLMPQVCNFINPLSANVPII